MTESTEIILSEGNEVDLQSVANSVVSLIKSELEDNKDATSIKTIELGRAKVSSYLNSLKDISNFSDIIEYIINQKEKVGQKDKLETIKTLFEVSRKSIESCKKQMEMLEAQMDNVFIDEEEEAELTDTELEQKLNLLRVFQEAHAAAIENLEKVSKSFERLAKIEKAFAPDVEKKPNLLAIPVLDALEPKTEDDLEDEDEEGDDDIEDLTPEEISDLADSGIEDEFDDDDSDYYEE